MLVQFYPDQKTVFEAMQVNDPLLMLISYDKSKILIANIDDSFEHYILLKQLDYSEMDIDKYYRIVINQEGADWTFVCPSGYKGIIDKDKRIEQFYNDGIEVITEAIHAIGYDCKINIPQRYRRHFNMLK
jgi:hypothetical protein